MPRNIQLLIIDPQNDFCDLPSTWHGIDALTAQRIAPSLPVAGAHADLQRLAGWVDRSASCLTQITITLDSHHRYDIAHPAFWQTDKGQTPSPFTVIRAALVREGAFSTRDAQAQTRALHYLDELESKGRYELMIWPVHCEIGTWGHGVHADVLRAAQAWEETKLKPLQYVYKGSNPWPEHYSAMQAEVPDAQDPDTQLQQALIDQLDQADLLLIAGQASSHCVRATTEHIANHLPSAQLRKLVLLTDCMSPVGGFEMQAQAFFTQMQARGVRIASSTDNIETL